MRAILGVALALLAVSPAAAKSWHLTTLHNFCTVGSCADGSFPSSGLVRDAQGNFYGVTQTGGSHNNGVVFRLKRKAGSYVFEMLHHFCGACGEANGPVGELIVDASGNLYGTALGGGAHNCGTVFELIKPKWKLKTLHSFCGNAKDGEDPIAALSYAGKAGGALYDGVSPLYGTTSRGGAHSMGVAFKLARDGNRWKESVLYTFCSVAQCADGAQPSGALLVDDAGNLFGNAFLGGTHGGGVTFKLTGKEESVLYSFCVEEDCPDGMGPTGNLVMDGDGAILGTTMSGNGETGVLFKLTPEGDTWQQSVLHTFCSPPDCADGYQPDGGLIADGKGNLFGIDQLGGLGEAGVGGGTAFQYKNGGIVPIYQFCSEDGCADGRVPTGAPVMDSHGDLFGVASQGGPTTAAGTIYRLSRRP